MSSVRWFLLLINLTIIISQAIGSPPDPTALSNHTTNSADHTNDSDGFFPLNSTPNPNSIDWAACFPPHDRFTELLQTWNNLLTGIDSDPDQRREPALNHSSGSQRLQDASPKARSTVDKSEDKKIEIHDRASLIQPSTRFPDSSNAKRTAVDEQGVQLSSTSPWNSCMPETVHVGIAAFFSVGAAFAHHFANSGLESLVPLDMLQGFWATCQPGFDCYSVFTKGADWKVKQKALIKLGLTTAASLGGGIAQHFATGAFWPLFVLGVFASLPGPAIEAIYKIPWDRILSQLRSVEVPPRQAPGPTQPPNDSETEPLMAPDLQLYDASLDGDITSVNRVIDKVADINAEVDIYGNALQAASLRGHQQIVQVLLDKGTNVNAKGGLYGNALQAASLRGDKQIVEILLGKGARVDAEGGLYGNALQAASYEGNKQAAEVLLRRGAEINAKGGPFGNALQAASYGGYTEVVEVLLEKGAEINAQGGFYGNALQAASFAGRQLVVELLLARGADVAAKGGLYDSALQAASEWPNPRIRELLRKKMDEYAAKGAVGNRTASR